MAGSHATVAIKPPKSAVRHPDGACANAMLRPRVGVERREFCGARSLFHEMLGVSRKVRFVQVSAKWSNGVWM